MYKSFTQLESGFKLGYAFSLQFGGTLLSVIREYIISRVGDITSCPPIAFFSVSNELLIVLSRVLKRSTSWSSTVDKQGISPISFFLNNFLSVAVDGSK